MTARRAAVVLIAVSLAAAPADATTFRKIFRGAGPVPSPTVALGNALADTVARSLPLTSASPGLTFRFDPASGAFERDTDLIGQLYLERPRPIGRGKWNITASYQRVHVDGVQGQALDNLSDTSSAIVVDSVANNVGAPRGSGLVKFNRYDVDLTVNMVTLAATYGITDNIDVNFTLPILASRLGINARESRFTFNPNTQELVLKNSQASDKDFSKTGVGDLFLRGKYRFFTNGWGELASGIVLRMPAGSKDNFQGTGDWELSPMLYAATRRIPLGGPVAIQAFFNGGIDLDINDVDQSEGRFGAGVDLALGHRATLSFGFLGREPFHSFAPSGFFDQPRLHPHNNTCQTYPNNPKRTILSTCPMAPLFGLSEDRASYYSLSIGGRVNLWRDTVFGFANVLIPLGDQGIQTAPIPLIGFEATF